MLSTYTHSLRSYEAYRDEMRRLGGMHRLLEAHGFELAVDERFSVAEFVVVPRSSHAEREQYHEARIASVEAGKAGTAYADPDPPSSEPQRVPPVAAPGAAPASTSGIRPQYSCTCPGSTCRSCPSP